MNVKDKLGLLGATILTLGIGGVTPALAQDAAPGAEESDVIVVTGSRLRRETFDSPNPTVQVGAQELEDRQLANVGDAIEDIPLVGLGGNTRGTNTQNGDSFILPDILDLGSQRTLTLLNGRRIQPTLPGTVFVPGNASGSQVDLSVINPAMVERVEVVAGTGGAIYGADAVGGVVNIITKDDYEGLELSVSAGMTEIGDGEQYRVSGLWGGNFLDDRLNVTVSADYFNQELVASGTESVSRYLGSQLSNTVNPLNGSSRNSAFSGAAAADALRAGGSLSAFNPAASDGIPTAFYGPTDLPSTLATFGGVLLTRHQLASGFATSSQVVPATPVHGSSASPGAVTVNGVNVPFFAPLGLAGTGLTAAQVFTAYGAGINLAGLSTTQQDALAVQLLQANRPTPYEYLLNNPGAAMAVVGTFGTRPNVLTSGGAANLANGFFPTIANPDGATAGFLPRVAVPLQFDANGNLTAFNPGDYTLPSLLSLAYGGEGFDVALGQLQIQAGTERFSFGGQTRFDITDNFRHRSEYHYSKIDFTIIGGAPSHTSGGSTQANTLGVPIFVDQNPFLTPASLNTIAGLEASGFTLPTFAGQDVLYLGRNMTDLIGGPTPTESENTNFRIYQGLEGEFELLDRLFYWDVAAYYGRSETISVTTGIKDIEFSLAVDVVNGPNGPVCRQQTLAAPEAIELRNPGVGAIVIAPSGVAGRTPSQAQIDACVPLNLFGNGAPSQAAIDYVIERNQTTSSLNTLEVYSGSLGGEILRLPAGWLQIGAQYEIRTESGEFEPDNTLLKGLTQTALQFTGGGTRDFTEYGYEVNLPVFGGDFSFPLMQELEFGYAWRFVERSQETEFFPTSGTPTEDDTFNYSFRWKPVDDITFRGARSRTVRSASLVELFDPGIRAFGGVVAATHPCSKANIGSGPNPAVRKANCIAAVVAYGYAPDAGAAQTFLDSFNHTPGAPNRPATAAGNPFLANEEGNAYTYGITYEPSFIPRLVLAADFFSVDMSGELGLVGGQIPAEACFDSTLFPDSIVGAANPACDAILFTMPNGTIPSVNPLTGRTSVLTNAFGGQAANPSAPFEVAALDFLNLNLAQRELRSVNWEARYNWPLGDTPLVGGIMENWGDMFLRATVYHTQRYDVFTPSLNRQAQEHTFPEYEARFDFRHRLGPFDHTLQWFWTSETFTDITSVIPEVERNQADNAEDFHYFNYFASYDINDMFTVRLTVNNLTDTEEPRGQYGAVSPFDGGLGREWVVGLRARF